MKKCKLVDCNNHCQKDDKGDYYNFCKRSHADEYKKYLENELCEETKNKYKPLKKCKLKGCNNECAKDENANYFDFCNHVLRV